MIRVKALNLEKHNNGQLIVSDPYYYYGNRIDIAYIDEEDFERISKYGWYISKKGYVYTMINNTTIPLHRFILNEYNSDFVVDHHDGNKLNNCKSNLILMTNKENVIKSWHEQKQREHLKKRVVMIDIQTNEEVNIFESVKQASIYLQQIGKTKGINQGSISNVCNGIRNTAGGYKWRWL